MENIVRHLGNGRLLLIWCLEMQSYMSKRHKFCLKLEIPGVHWRQQLVSSMPFHLSFMNFNLCLLPWLFYKYMLYFAFFWKYKVLGTSIYFGIYWQEQLSWNRHGRRYTNGILYNVVAILLSCFVSRMLLRCHLIHPSSTSPLNELFVEYFTASYNLP